MKINSALILSYALLWTVGAPALAQCAAVVRPQIRVNPVQTAVLPARIVRVVVLPSPLSDALDTADALRDQYYAEDTFQSMLVGF